MNASARDETQPVSVARWSSRVLGIVFILLGILGLTSGGTIMDVATVNALHSALHLVTGVGLLAAGVSGEGPARAASWLAAGLYGLLGLLGLAGVAAVTSALRLDAALSWLYVILAIVWIAVAGVSQTLAHGRYRARASRRPA
ncbi:MAG: DUF4383 domain-containing protein [Phycisphaeraceae bacterium]